MAKITGIEGLFFRARDPKALAAWYERHLGVDDIASTVWRQQEGPTIVAPFALDTEYLGLPNSNGSSISASMTSTRSWPN